MQKKQKTPLETAAKLLSMRPLARLELKRKLADKGFSWAVAESTAAECERLGFLNDSQTAESAIAMMRSRGDGARKIRMKLKQRGFGKDDVDSAFETDSADRSETDVALSVLKRKERTLLREPDPFKRRRKALAALAAKGCTPDAAFEAVSRFFGKNGTAFPEEESGSAG